MSLLQPFPVQAVTGDTVPDFTAVDLRMLVGSQFSQEGVVGSTSLVVSQHAGGANSSVDISAGQAIINCDTVSLSVGPGSYLVTNTSVFNLAVPAAPASGTRIHRVVARITDKGASNGTTYQWAPVLLEDIGGGTPAIPNSAIHLALVTRAHGDSAVTNAKIDNEPDYATSTGGVVHENSGWMGPASRDVPFTPGGGTRIKVRSIETGSDSPNGIFYIAKPTGWMNLLGAWPMLAWRTSGQTLAAQFLCRKDDNQSDGSIKFQLQHANGSGPMPSTQFAAVFLLIGQ